MFENYSCQLFERWFVDISFEYQIQSLDYFSATGRYSVPFLLPGVSFVPVLSVALSAVEVSSKKERQEFLCKVVTYFPPSIQTYLYTIHLFSYKIFDNEDVDSTSFCVGCVSFICA
jgi:hypothetical protein